MGTVTQSLPKYTKWLEDSFFLKNMICAKQSVWTKTAALKQKSSRKKEKVSMPAGKLEKERPCGRIEEQWKEKRTI